VTAYRPMLDVDREFVISAWSSSFRMSPYAGPLAMDTYADVMHAEIEQILARPSTQVIVAHEPGETIDGGRPFLYGFIVRRIGGQRPYVYYVFVKHFYRRGGKRHALDVGHARGLFAAAGINPLAPFSYMCRTLWSDRLATKIPLAEWNPIAGRYEEPKCSPPISQFRRTQSAFVTSGS